MAGIIFGKVGASFFVAGALLVRFGMIAGARNVVFTIQNARGEREK